MPPGVPVAPPVTGVPIIQMPGCVPVHPDAHRNPQLLVDDPNRVGYSCPEGEVPSYTPMDYTPSQLKIIEEKPKQQPQEADKPPEAKPPEQRVEPPGPPAQETRTEAPEPKSLPEKIVDGLPTVQATTTAAGVAVIATASAVLAKPAAELLLKLIKPAVKKISKSIAKIRKKPIPVLSVRERVLAQRDRNRAIMALRRALKP